MQYKNIVLYGAGKCYQNLKGMLSALCEINYICDRKFTHEESVDGVETIHRSQVKDLEKCLVIICLYNQEEALKVKRSFESEGIECKLYNEILNLGQIQPMEYDELKEKVIDGKYIDEFNNRIEFAGEIPENIRVNFIGVDNYVYIGENVKAHRKLIVRCGTRARVIIGDNCTFHDVDLDASWESIEIGDDCMFSFGVFLRNTDVHHIFSAADGKRINWSKPIKIGNHVWIGQSVILLKGFQIGDDSIVGAGSVSSGKFTDNIIIAGNPAKVIREEMIWDRDVTFTYNYATINR